jgi:hypothetical protein
MDTSLSKNSIVVTNQVYPATSNPTGTASTTVAGLRSTIVPNQMPPATSNPTGASNTSISSLRSNISVINALNFLAADNLNIAQVAHD